MKDRCGSPQPALLVTVDVEIAHDRDLAQQSQSLVWLAEALDGVPSTFFVTADAAEAFGAELRLLAERGHEIGCHGLDHSALDDYSALSPANAKQRLQEATRRIGLSTGSAVRSFRGPRMTTSAATQSVLRSLGFSSDFSACSHRADALCASRFRMEWLGLGARPYVPARHSAFAPDPTGRDASLLVVPLSGFGLPFLSGALYVLGRAIFKRFAAFLAWRARRARSPIVYLLHSYEFAELAGSQSRLPWHHRLYAMPPRDRLAANLELISFLTGTCRLVPQTASAFVAAYRRS